MKIMPFFLPVFSFTLPAGLVLYFLVSNLYRFGQQAFITRTMYGVTRRTGRPVATAGSPSAPMPGVLGSGRSRSRPTSRRRVDHARRASKAQSHREARARRRQRGLRRPRHRRPTSGQDARQRTSERTADRPRIKEKAASAVPSNAPGSSSGRVTPIDEAGQRDESDRRRPCRPPTLQPRSRKNKKR